MHGILRTAKHVFTRSPSKSRDFNWPPGFVVSGFFGETFGVARSADLTVEKLERLGFKVIRHHITDFLTSKNYFGNGFDAPEDYGWIIHCNAPEALHALAKTNPNKIPKGPRLGYWAWELEDIPADWKQISRVFDQIIVPSSFVRDSFGGLSPNVVRRSHPVETSDLVRNLKGPKRDTARTFLVQMDGKSSLSRKNVGAAIRAFRHAFGDKPEFKLIVKTQFLNARQQDAIKGWIDGALNIEWVDKTLTDPQMVEMWQDIDCVISTHRSEGYGLALAEAASTGRQAYATAWSGNLDFMCNQPKSLIDYRFIKVKESDDVYGPMADGERRWAEVQFSSVVQTFLRAAETNSYDQGGPMREKLSQLSRDWSDVAPDQPLYATDELRQYA
ncbi:hypothetical protein [Ponticaulis sp.]|uniref:glycosyltransferase n=1 Tax=Ponticaulis sp. TaxID=2020902 RepID=UPI000C903574|nr:hypothetical protein [Ponticaulis sp.]MAI89474.1 hypothetical protein [Ponticaulis sp.]